MRFISKHQRYQFIGRKARLAQFNQDGELVREGVPTHTCYFRQSDTTEWEREIARRTFTFSGVPLNEDGITAIDPINRVSSYDTDEDPLLQADSELKGVVEARLLQWQGPGDHILVSKPKLPEPWPGYDRLTASGRNKDALIAEKVAQRVQEDEYTLEEIERVLAYERENGKRPMVVAALEALCVSEDMVAA
jgi:hypothetical protein